MRCAAPVMTRKARFFSGLKLKHASEPLESQRMDYITTASYFAQVFPAILLLLVAGENLEDKILADDQCEDAEGEGLRLEHPKDCACIADWLQLHEMSHLILESNLTSQTSPNLQCNI